MRQEGIARRNFIALWVVVTALKLAFAARLPLFVDEAFYWQEGRHLAWAYSDLPGLTAWLVRLGVALGGDHPLAVRAPFLALAALLPWLVMRICARWFGAAAGWRAGMLALLMPLAGTLGLLALPDVPMALATVLCLDAGARLLQRVDAGGAIELAMGLALGALSHYRFLGVIGVGFVALMLLPQGRRALRDPRVLIALGVGIAAWMPLLGWNLNNAEAGLRFQLLDRHPWSFQPTGIQFLLVQAVMVTPLLFAALMQTFVQACRARSGMPAQWRYFGLLGGVSTLGFFALGFFADTERVSFHWPLPGYLALLVAAPVVLVSWPRWLRRATWALAALGLAGAFGYYALVSTPEMRAQLAGSRFYPSNFVGWNRLAGEVAAQRARMPADTRIVADNFKLSAELGFALHAPDIAILPHPLNRKHGRAPQLTLWGLRIEDLAAIGPHPVLLVAGTSEVEYKNLLAHYHALCARVGPLPPPRVVNIDHGRQRFLLFALPRRRGQGPCTAPAMAWIDSPPGATQVGRRFEVRGWAFKDGIGLSGVDVMLDGRVVAKAEYGLPDPGVARYWKISSDPGHPQVGFRAQVDATGMAPGRHWLGLRLHGRDGSLETWSEQAVDIAD